MRDLQLRALPDVGERLGRCCGYAKQSSLLAISICICMFYAGLVHLRIFCDVGRMAGGGLFSTMAVPVG